MNKFYTILLVGLGFFCQHLTAQSVDVEGTVKDSLSNPLELANVIAINKNTKAIASFGITDSEGRYRLTVKADSLYTLRASYLGFETWEETIQPSSSEKLIKDIVMKELPDQLDAVEIIHEMPVTVSGDTIIYKADAFTDGKEKKLENVLEKLPGFEIDDNGEVKVQGKKVDKVLVEGKEFFDGDTKMATKNIPANAVDKVQVLRDFNEVGPMKGLGNDDALALNIKLKDGKKNLLFGDVEAGIGPDHRHLVHPNIFYYSKKLSVNFIGDLNNIGERAFTMQDYFRFSGGLRSLMRRSGSSLNLSSDEVGLSFMQNNRARNVDSKLGALNFTYRPNNKWNFTGFGIVSNIQTDMASNSFRTYIREEGNNQENLVSRTGQENTSGLVKLSSTFTPNDKVHVAYDGFIKTATLDQVSIRDSEFDMFANTINSNNLSRPFSIEQTLESFYAKDEKNVFSFEANHMYKKQDPTFDLQTSQIPFNGILSINGNSPFNIFQQQEVFTNKLDAALNYYYVINKTNHINFSVGGSFSHQSLTSGIDERFADGTSTAYTDTNLNNDVTYDFSDVFFGLRYKTKFGKLMLSPGLNFHIYNTQDQQLATTNEFDKTLLLPEFSAKYDFSSGETLRADYRMQAEFTDIQNLALGTIIRGYNSLFSGNRNLENAWYHNLSVNYYNFNMFNFTNINLGLTYQKKFDDIQNVLNYQNLDRISSPINIDAANETLRGYGSYEKRFTFMKVRASTNLSYAKFNNFIDNVANENTSFTQNYKASIDTNFKKWPNFEVGFEKIINDYQSDSGNSTFVTDRPFANFEAYFLKNFTLVADYEYNAYRNRDGGTSSNYDFLNASLYFQKEDSKWEFKLSGMNLLNTTSIRRDSFSGNLISTYEYFVQPRYFIFSAKYNL